MKSTGKKKFNLGGVLCVQCTTIAYSGSSSMFKKKMKEMHDNRQVLMLIISYWSLGHVHKSNRKDFS